MGQPFARLNALVAVLQSFLGKGVKYPEAFALSGLGNYQSRGKNKSKGYTRSHFSNKSRQGARSKYMPHQGKQEVMRRGIQENRILGGKELHFSKIQYTTIVDNLKAANQNQGERRYG